MDKKERKKRNPLGLLVKKCLKTLILLLAMYLRNEKEEWQPRIGMIF